MEWQTIASYSFTFLCGGSGGVLLNWFINRNKIRNERRGRFQESVGAKIAEAITQVRKVELKANIHEIYDIDNIVESRELVDLYEGVVVYPEIMGSQEALHNYFEEINDLRKEYDQYLDSETASYLFYISKYLFQLKNYLNTINSANNYPEMGTIFIYDIQTWQKSFDKLLVDKINSVSCELEAHEGEKWEREKDAVIKKFWNESVLYKIINDVDDDKIKRVKEMIQILCIL